MDREHLTELLRNPAQVAKSDLPDLRSMAERFPWFSGARLLLAVGEHKAGDLLASEGHNLPAAFLPSREVLFELTHPEGPVKPPTLNIVHPERQEDGVGTRTGGQVSEKAPVPILPTDQPYDPPAGMPTTSLDREPGKPGDPAAIEVEELEGAVKEEVKEEEEVGTREQAGPQAQEAPTAQREQLDSERELLERMYQEARAGLYDLGQSRPRSGTAQREAPPEAHPEVPAAPVEVPGMAASALPERLGFTAWLELGALAGANAPATPPGGMPAAAPTPPAQVVPKGAPLGEKELLDRFIQMETPPPPKERATFFTPQQAAKRSLQDEGMVSETLARIHENQGNLAKAKEVYDRLAARDPEKSVYFAALSKAVEARMNK